MKANVGCMTPMLMMAGSEGGDKESKCSAKFHITQFVAVIDHPITTLRGSRVSFIIVSR